jgi:hypothetical protein
VRDHRNAGDFDLGLAPIDLRLLTKGSAERDEDLVGLGAQPRDVAPDRGLAAPELVLADKTIVDSFGGVALLGRSMGIGGEPALDQRPIGIHCRARAGLA